MDLLIVILAALYNECKKKFVTVGRLEAKRLNCSVKYLFSCAGEW